MAIDTSNAVMQTTAGQLGAVVGLFLASLVIPIIILVICNFIPAMKRKPRWWIYAICWLLAAVVDFGAADTVMESLLAATLHGIFFYWGYHRAVKKSAPV